MMTVTEALEKKKGHAFAHLQEQFYIELIESSLSYTNGNGTEASRLLGLSYETFNNWRKRLGIDIEIFKKPENQTQLKNKIEDALHQHLTMEKAAESLGYSNYKMSRLMKHFNLSSRYFNRISREEIVENMGKFRYRKQLADYLDLDKKTLKDYMQRYDIQDPWARSA